MVDSTKGIGSIPGIVRSEPKGVSRPEKSEEKRSVSDRVEISEEALSLQEAEAKAKQVKEELSKDQELTLGLDPSFEDAA